MTEGARCNSRHPAPRRTRSGHSFDPDTVRIDGWTSIETPERRDAAPARGPYGPFSARASSSPRTSRERMATASRMPLCERGPTHSS